MGNGNIKRNGLILLRFVFCVFGFTDHCDSCPVICGVCFNMKDVLL